MAKGSPGADSSAPVNTQLNGKTLVQLATDTYGVKPVFWGRYFTSTSSTGTVEYRHLKENPILRANNIPVLPIARQTKNVKGSQADGASDAEDNAEDIITAFGADYLWSIRGEFLVFLDVEGSPSLAKAYYTGWARTLTSHSLEFSHGKAKLLPCVYATQSDDVTWKAVSDAAAAGTPCAGAWIARWRTHGCSALPDWDDDILSPNVDIPCKVLLWQYSDDCHGAGGFDCDQTNPAIDLNKDILSKLILPPGTVT